jgi:hypothetical protein
MQHQQQGGRAAATAVVVFVRTAYRLNGACSSKCRGQLFLAQHQQVALSC